MQTFLNDVNDKQLLSQAKDEQFESECINEFTNKSLTTENRSKVLTLSTWSYLPNFVSSATACFFILYLLKNYTLLIQIFIGAILCLVVIGIEIGKRSLISQIAKHYFLENKIKSSLLAACALLIFSSMTTSYFGGEKLVVSNADLPHITKNVKIDSLSKVLSMLNKSIAAQEAITWEGKVTRSANKNLNRLFLDRSAINSKITKLENEDNLVYQDVLLKHSNQITSFGLILGLIAAFADVTLFWLVWTIKRLKNEVRLLLSTKIDGTTVSLNKVNITNIKPTVGGFSINETKQPNRTNIGFKRYSNGERDVERIKLNIDSGKQRECKHCGEIFTYKHWNAQYCGDKCRLAAWEKRTGKRFKKKAK